ncbi:hypothetical protein BDZ97DRAFT_1835627 [Flammula alnicola]|nr:hypothetical protein BDZ97DRAFT_1835627 [Flammula alnicola]
MRPEVSRSQGPPSASFQGKLRHAAKGEECFVHPTAGNDLIGTIMIKSREPRHKAEKTWTTLHFKCMGAARGEKCSTSFSVPWTVPRGKILNCTRMGRLGFGVLQLYCIRGYLAFDDHSHCCHYAPFLTVRCSWKIRTRERIPKLTVRINLGVMLPLMSRYSSTEFLSFSCLSEASESTGVENIFVTTTFF